METGRGKVRTIITRAIVFLLLGAVVNMAVAWGFNLAVQKRVIDNGRFVDVYLRATESDGEMLVHAGFPLRCLQGAFVWDTTLASNKGISTRAVDALSIGNPFAPIVFPTRPLWPSVAINTTFYAAILWLSFASAEMVRRRLRLKRGRCPACAYPIGTSAVCTECGAALRDARPFTASSGA